MASGKATVGQINNVWVNLDTRLIKYKREVAKEVVARVRQRTPIRTGFLWRSWEYQMHNYSVSFKNAAPYADFVENGTPFQAPQRMLQRTLLEVDEIGRLVAQRLGIKVK